MQKIQASLPGVYLLALTGTNDPNKLFARYKSCVCFDSPDAVLILLSATIKG